MQTVKGGTTLIFILLFVSFYSFSHALNCIKCTNAESISECRSEREAVCTPPYEQCYTEVVITSLLTRRYNAGCRSNRICTLIAKIMGKRNSLDRRDSSISCSSCCSQNNGGGIPCNADLCGLSSTEN
ncbi:uncharacterized protein LOC134726896 [Mytilus trossulus]|uniref:uncharacterized protein LOC134726896 n=1 Tax=Mytilus trossulus TaxID=6551 RepID=UPI00300665CB